MTERKTRGPMTMGPRQRARSNADLLAELYGVSRTTIQRYFNTQEKKLSEYDDVSDYILDNLHPLLEKALKKTKK